MPEILEQVYLVLHVYSDKEDHEDLIATTRSIEGGKTEAETWIRKTYSLGEHVELPPWRDLGDLRLQFGTGYGVGAIWIMKQEVKP